MLMCQRRITLPKNCTKSLKLAPHISQQTFKSPRPFPWVWLMSAAAVAGYTSCLSSMTKRALNWSGAETHPGGTGSPAQKLKWCFLPNFCPCGHHRDNMHFFKGVTFLERSNIHIHIYRKELLSHRLFWVL